MKDTLVKVLNTLMTIETKGNNTILMGSCLQTIDQLIPKVDEMQKEIDTLKQEKMAAKMSVPVETDEDCVEIL